MRSVHSVNISVLPEKYLKSQVLQVLCRRLPPKRVISHLYTLFTSTHLKTLAQLNFHAKLTLGNCLHLSDAPVGMYKVVNPIS